MQYVFLFPGQGSQKIGMGQYLQGISVCDQTFAQANAALGYSITDIMNNGPEEELQKTFHAQPAILTVAVAIGRYLKEQGIQPLITAGHSLGEYACLVLGEAMHFEDAVQAVHQRGKYMQEAVPLGVGTMSAILGVQDHVVEQVCREVSGQGFLVEPANYNCPGQLVISGSIEGVQKASDLLKTKGAKRCIALPVSAPFHCSMLKPAAEKMAQTLETIAVQDPKIPYIANVDASIVKTGADIKEKLVSQIDHPVRWTQTLVELTQMYPEAVFVEVGAAKVVTGHVKKVNPEIQIATTDSLQSIQTLLS
ncbi:MAG: ACP S-malonyltransferase [Bdellovibrionota bacterium]